MKTKIKSKFSPRQLKMLRPKSDSHLVNKVVGDELIEVMFFAAPTSRRNDILLLRAEREAKRAKATHLSYASPVRRDNSGVCSLFRTQGAARWLSIVKFTRDDREASKNQFNAAFHVAMCDTDNRRFSSICSMNSRAEITVAR